MAEVQSENTMDAPKISNGHDAVTPNKSHYDFPDAKTLKEVGELPIKDENGKEIPFKSLYENQPGRQLIVFIRHFYCGHCEAYVRYLAKNFPPSTLATTNPPTTLTLIGCGQPVCIPDYRTRTMSGLEKPYAIYTDPTRAIYTKLNMIVSLSPGEEGWKKPEYLTSSILADSLTSMKNILTSGPKGFKGGNYSQNGGEWVFEGGELKWVRRMRNTGDHTLVEELTEVLGLEGKQ